MATRPAGPALGAAVLTILLLSVAALAAEPDAPLAATEPDSVAPPNPGGWPVDPVDAPWMTTPLGVEVQDVVVGEGAIAVQGAGVSVHYRGLLADGTEFDASRGRGRPFSIRIGAGEVIPGWEDGIVGMKVGGRRRMVIPSHLGYGDRAIGPIPADSTLYFEVE